MKFPSDKILISACALVTAVTLTVHAFTPSAETMEYRTTVRPGDTVWSLCARIASNRDDMETLVCETIKQNHIEDPTHLQPGTELHVRVVSVADLAGKENR